MKDSLLHPAASRELATRSWSLVTFILVMALLPGVPAHANELFVAPAGDDAAAGTVDHPFATVNRAQRAAAPGDTVWLRGGSYAVTEAQIARRTRGQAHVFLLDKSGEPARPITYAAYRDERPVFDFAAVKPVNLRVHAFQVTGSYLHLKGIEVTGVQVTIKGHTQSICFSNDGGSHNVYELLRMHDGMGIGYYALRGSHNLVLNCDAWNNWDNVSENGKGGNVDGFGCHPPAGSVGNVFRGCRAWFNSDDGYDCINARESVTFENCWAMYNGFGPKFERLADGNGFKAGGYGATPADALPNPIPRHVVRRCLAVRNKNSGFYANHHPGGDDFLANTAFANGINFNMQGRLMDNVTEVDGTGHHILANLAYRGPLLLKVNREKCQVAGNSFDLTLKLSDADFEAVDDAELTGPRQPDGTLPAVKFMRPTPTGAMADKKIGALDVRK